MPRTLGREIVGETRLENLEQWFTEKSVIYLVFSSSNSSSSAGPSGRAV